MLRKALLLLSGNAVGAVLSLARNLLIARLLPVEDYGIAATFALTLAVMDMMSALGLQTQIVQARDGDDPRFQAALQGFQVLRGVVAAALLLVLAGPIAAFMRLPEIEWAYRALAILPLLGGFMHFDIQRMNRTMRFGPLIVAGTLPVALTLLAVWPLVAWLGDWRVMLAVLVMQRALRLAATHLLAERAYRIRLDPAVMRRNLSFGWPLLVNGILLFGVFQGDKLLVARELGPTVLAYFAMGVTLTLSPTVLMAKSVRTLFLPRLSAVEGPAFDRLARTVMQAAMVNAGITVAGVFVLGPPFVALVLGEAYQPMVPYLAPLAAVQAIRVLKAGPGVVALARGQTTNAMIANLFRVATLPLVWLALVEGRGLGAVIALGVLGEVLGYAAALVLVRRRLGQPLRPLLAPLAATALLMAAASGLAGPALAAAGFAPPPGALTALVLALLALQCVLCDGLRDAVLWRLRRRIS